MLKTAVNKLESWGRWLHERPVYLLPVTVWPLVLVYAALLLIWLWLVVTKPLRRANHG